MSILANHNNPIKTVVISSFLMFSLLFSTAGHTDDSYQLPDFDLKQSASDERQGVNLLRAIWRTDLVTKDVENALYIRRLGQKISSFSERPDKHFDFFLINSNQINAFAGHYGYIGFFTGLVMASNTEAQLASVFAHEVSHITQNHLARHQKSSSRNNYLLIAGILTAMIAGGSAGQAVLSSTVGGIAQSSINFTRENEWEADRVGMALLVKSGFSAQGMPNFFRKLLAIDADQTLEFLRTHPLSINRVAEAQQRADTYSGGVVTSFEYEVLRAKLLYHHHNGSDFYAPPQAQQYVKAWAAFNKADYEEARTQAQALFADNTSSTLKILLARIYAKTQQSDLAISVLNEVLTDDPSNEAAMYYLAEIYADNNQLQRAIKALRGFINNHSVMPYSHEKLAELYLKDKQVLRHHLSRVDVLYQKSEFVKAKQQLMQAKNHAYDNYFTARVDSKLIEVDKLIKDFGD